MAQIQDKFNAIESRLNVIETIVLVSERYDALESRLAALEQVLAGRCVAYPGCRSLTPCIQLFFRGDEHAYT